VKGQDNGTWLFHFSGSTEGIEELNIEAYVEVYVSPYTNQLGTLIGRGYFIGFYSGDFEKDVTINVNPPDCTDCYIHLKFYFTTPQGSSPYSVASATIWPPLSHATIKMYTGHMGKYTYLVIPENILAFLPFALSLLAIRLRREGRRKVNGDCPK